MTSHQPSPAGQPFTAHSHAPAESRQQNLSLRQGAAGQRDAAQQILASIVRQTDESGRLTTADKKVLAKLQHVAKQLGDLPFDKDKVLIPLVSSIFSSASLLTVDQRTQLSHSVATSIINDQAASVRVARLWDQLRRGANDAE